MAESSSSSHPPVSDDEYNLEDDAERKPVSRRGSTSTTASRRQNYFDSQRGAEYRRSRPASVASQATLKAKGKRASYQQPSNYDNLDETAIPLPTHARDDRAHLEDARGRGTVESRNSGQAMTNFSRPDGFRKRGTSGATNQEQTLSEIQAVPPVPKTERLSSATTARYKQSEERGPVPESESSNNDPLGTRNLMGNAKPVSRWLTEVYTMSYLIFFAILGTLARLGVQWMAFYPGAPVTTPVIWANMVGSMIMGFLSEDQALFREHIAQTREGDIDTMEKTAMTSHKKTIPLYIGLATGFCGSFTSFSSFARDLFLALANSLPAPINHSQALSGGTVTISSTIGRNGGYSFEAMLGVVLSTLALSLGGLFVGAHIALALEGITPSLPTRLIRTVLDPLCVFLGWGCWLGAILLSILPPDRPGGPAFRGPWINERWRGEVLFALVFAPLGCLLRFYVSLKLNGLVAAFPLGTFAANMFGTAIESMCYDIQHVGVGVMGQVGGGIVGCQVLQGVMDGFCGCLTTVSTWVAEMNALKRKHGYIYMFSSVLGALCLTVIIMGSVRWSVGYTTPVCSTGYPSKLLG